MNRKAPLTCQSKKIDLVIRKCKSYPIDLIKRYCEDTFVRYAFIVHDGDIQPSTGEIESIHYHIVGDAKEKGVAFSTRLNVLISKQYLNEDNADGIEIDQYRTFEGALQYLTHKNNPEKSPHSKDDIVHNMTEQEFNIFYEADVGNCVTFELLYNICDMSNSILDVMREIGNVNVYLRYRHAIWDIWKSLKGDEEYRK